MSLIQRLQSVETLNGFAEVLGYQPKSFSYILYKIPDDKKYSEFQIPKSSGGVRTILSPTPKLKVLQQKLAALLYDYLQELDKGSSRNFKKVSHGFERDRSIMTNAKAHKNRRYVLNVDIENFFDTINFGRVRGIFIKDKRFKFHPNVATLIAQIACFQNKLPQGSPCSPVISNIVGNLIDAKLVKLATSLRCSYTRYADDITFSTNTKSFPVSLAVNSVESPSVWHAGEALLAIMSQTSFTLNPSKTRLQLKDSRQGVTGLVVNRKVNVSKEYYKTLRAKCQSLFDSGTFHSKIIIPATPIPSILQSGDINSLEGTLSHVFRVKRFTTEGSLTGIKNLYNQFLFYKHFVALDRPLLITEGKTDIVYIRAAMMRLHSQFPTLGSFGETTSSFSPAVTLLKPSKTLDSVMGYFGGGSKLRALVKDYRKKLLKYRHRPLSHPVIILVDNDDESKKMFSSIKEIKKKFAGFQDITLVSGNDFYWISDNLYLVKTPEKTTQTPESCIEDMFTTETLATKLNGKSFSTANDYDSSTHYGKTDFAEKIVWPNRNQIEFAGFAPLLARIQLVIEDYATKQKS